jgi:hypothetical protein
VGRCHICTGTRSFLFSLTAGFHTLSWVYKKDASDDRGADLAIVRCDPYRPIERLILRVLA